MSTQHTSHDHQNDSTLVDRLDRLAAQDRSEPGAGFERSIVGAMTDRPALARPIPGRRRRSSAWVPFAAAVFVGLFAAIAWPTSQMVPSDGTGAELAALETDPDAQDAELLVVSFDALDSLLASDGAFAADLDRFEMQMDSTDTDLSDVTDWMDLGESL